MKKALEFLTKLKQSRDFDGNLEYSLEKAIKELEEAIKPKCCAICKQFKEHNRYKVGICEKGHADNTRGGLYTVDYDFCCNRYEPKEQ